MQVEIVNADKKIRYNFGDIWALVQPFYLFIIPFLLGRFTVQFMSKDLADQVFICADVIIGMLLMYAGALIILEYKHSGIYQELKGKWYTKKLQRMLREYDLAGAELLPREKDRDSISDGAVPNGSPDPGHAQNGPLFPSREEGKIEI